MSKKILTISILSIFLIGVFWGCEEYQDETYNISSLDTDACYLFFLHDTSSTLITAKKLTTYNETWENSIFIMSHIPAVIDSLMSDNIVVAEDETRFKITTSVNVDTNYVAFNTESKNLVVYVDDFVELNIMNESGTIIAPATNAIDMETIYYSVTPDTSQDIDCSKVRVREVYNFTEDKHLIQVIKTDQIVSTKGIINMVILKNQ